MILKHAKGIKHLFHFLRPAAALVVCVIVGACGGGAGPSYATLESQYRSDFEAIRSQGFTDPRSLPDSGTVGYQGVLALDIDRADTGTDSVAGQIALTVDFGDNEVRGSARNFVNADDQRYGGSLTVSDAPIDRNVNISRDFLVRGQLNGVLTAPDGVALDTQTDMRASLVGNGSYFVGVVDGEASSSVDPTVDISGAFIAER